MIGCRDPKYKCGTVLPSSCISFSGPKLTCLAEEDQLDCDSSMDDVIFSLDAEIKKLQDSFDLTGLDKACLDFDPETVTIPQLHQLQITAICENTADIAALMDQFNDLNISNEIITIDLPDCLEADAAPCAVGTNQYQLLSLLVLLANKICNHEDRISDLE